VWEIVRGRNGVVVIANKVRYKASRTSMAPADIDEVGRKSTTLRVFNEASRISLAPIFEAGRISTTLGLHQKENKHAHTTCGVLRNKHPDQRTSKAKHMAPKKKDEADDRVAEQPLNTRS